MRVMLDNGIGGHSQFAEFVQLRSDKPSGIREVGGFVRKQPDPHPEYQAEIDALYTVGRMIREGKLRAFTYVELMFERSRRQIGEREFDALNGCTIEHVPPPVERSRFRSTVNFTEYTSKGGRNDLKTGKNVKMGQIAFVKFLLGLDQRAVQNLLTHKSLIGLSEFEVESFANLPCLHAMCRARNSENYLDMFHLWAAQRTRMDVFLTLEKRLPNIAKTFPKGGFQPSYPTKVLRPRELLMFLRVEVDPVPIEFGMFYPIWGGSVPIEKVFDLPTH